MKKILLLAVWMVFNTALMAQQVFITEDEKVTASSIIEENSKGLIVDYVLKAQMIGDKWRPGGIRITSYDKNLKQASVFDGMPWAKKENYFFIDRIYLKEKVIVFYLVQKEKPAKFDVVAVEVDKSTLKGSAEEKILLSGDGFAMVSVDNPGKSDSDLFKISSFRYPDKDYFKVKMFGMKNFDNSSSATHVFTKELKLVHTFSNESDVSTYNGEFEANGNANSGLTGSKKSRNLAIKGDFVFVKNQWAKDEKQRQDILEKIEYRVIKKDGSSDVKSVSLQEYQLLSCYSYYNEKRNEITVVGMKKGENSDFYSGVQIVTINADTYVVTQKKFAPYSEDLVKKVNLFYDLSKSPSGQLPSDLMFIDFKEAKDGTSYFVWQFFKNKSYTRQSPTAPATRNEQRMNEMMNDVTIMEYGPLLILGVDDKLNQKWMNFVPSLIQEFTDFRMMKPFLKIIDEKLHIFYNENRDVVSDGFNVMKSQKSKDLYSTCPVDLVVESDGKMSRKTIGDEKLIGKRVLFNEQGEDGFGEKSVYFLIKSHKMFALPEFIRITY